MGLKWTNFKFDMGYRQKKVSEASANPRTRSEAFRDYIKKNYSEKNLTNYENIDITFGNLTNDRIENIIEEISSEFPFIQKAAVIFVTDNGHIGYGWVYTMDENGQVTKKEEYQGYEGAEGEDVAGMISDDYNIRITPVWPE